MTTYDRSTRQRLHYRLRRFVQFWNALLATLLLLVVMAGWSNCRPTWGGMRCRDGAGHTWVVCDHGWKPQPQTLTCGAK